MMKNIYGLAGRQAVGLVESLFEVTGINLAVPEHSTVSRRLASLEVRLPVAPKEGARHVVTDATGIRFMVKGNGRPVSELGPTGRALPVLYGVSERRTWRKLHLAVDEQTGEILAAQVTPNDKKDGQLLEPLLKGVEAEIKQVSADGAYEQRSCYDVLSEHNVKTAIPPRKDAKIWQHGNCKAMPHPRDESLRAIRKHRRKKCKRLCYYHRRALAETTMFRFKTTFTATAFSRLFDNQVVELKLKCKVLNMMIQLAKPESCLAT